MQGTDFGADLPTADCDATLVDGVSGPQFDAFSIVEW